MSGIIEDGRSDSHIETILKTLPSSAGVYQYFDKEGKLIYVGKAKNLKNRVSSYFRNDGNQSAKTKVLVRKIADIKLGKQRNGSPVVGMQSYKEA